MTRAALLRTCRLLRDVGMSSRATRRLAIEVGWANGLRVEVDQ